jgi:sugar phosphate isomerase/epimerase
MQLGIFARTFSRPGFEETFDAVQTHGLGCLQFNFACAGLPSVPETIEPALVRRIRNALQARSLSIAAVSGTCNLIHPDPVQRAENLNRLTTIIGAARGIGTRIVTLCTGTRDAQDMWKFHPDNSSPEAWRDLIRSIEALLPIAEEYQVILGIEPEPANIINSAQSAHKFLDQLKSPSLKIIFDAANLVASPEIEQQRRVLSEACDLLGSEIVLTHAKDLVVAGSDEANSHYKTGL